MILDYKKYVCDVCGESQLEMGNAVETKDIMRDQHGWIISRDKKHYCSTECYDRRKV